MIGLGTIINTVAVIAGGLLGMAIKHGVAEKFEKILMQVLGLATLFIGAGGVLKYMLVVENGAIETRGTMLLIFSLVLGSILGQVLDIENRMERLGIRLKAAVKIKNDSHFVEGFVNASLIVCVGAMAIVGAVQDGLSGDSSMLLTKALLDFVLVVILASTYGIGAVFSALPIFVYQGTITLVAAIFGAAISPELTQTLSFVGSALIFCVGINLIRNKFFCVANMLPALLIPVVWEICNMLF